MPGKLRMYISTKYTNCTVEESVPLPDDWSTMTKIQRNNWIDEEWDTFLGNNTDMSHQVVED